MKPVNCIVKHNPPESYGDCLRACVASVIERDDVPHFAIDGNGEASVYRMREYLAPHGIIPAYFPISGEAKLTDVFDHMTQHYPHTEYLLFCQCGGNDHCVIGCDDKIIHDPAWYRMPVEGPHSAGMWIVIILARI